MITKNRKVITIALVSLVVILLAIFIFTLPKPSIIETPTPTVPVYPTDAVTGQEIYTPKSADITKISSTVSDSVSQTEKNKMKSFLPMTIKDFAASNGKITNVNIYALDSEPSQIIHLEIYGINYNLSEATTDNPQAVAFSETFTNVKKLLLQKGINLANLQIVYGNREYIQTTAENWINTFNLLP